MHLRSTLPVFALASIMAPASQITATSFAAQTPDPNKQLIDSLTANLVWLLEPLVQAVRENQQPQRPRYEPCFNQPQQPPYQRQQNCGPSICYQSINTSESTRKKKKAKVDFVLDPNKPSILTANNNEPPKLEPPEIVQKSEPYSVVKDLIETLAHIIFVDHLLV
ncbi:hypothetical protein G9A89_000830 [Geosiphon pyriformis]|nr:hypothetical protein G9A89_000830 [Geosiphon pyriformis]